MELADAIKARRSVRRFKPDPVFLQPGNQVARLYILFLLLHNLNLLRCNHGIESIGLLRFYFQLPKKNCKNV